MSVVRKLLGRAACSPALKLTACGLSSMVAASGLHGQSIRPTTYHAVIATDRTELFGSGVTREFQVPDFVPPERLGRDAIAELPTGRIEIPDFYSGNPYLDQAGSRSGLYAELLYALALGIDTNQRRQAIREADEKIRAAGGLAAAGQASDILGESIGSSFGGGLGAALNRVSGVLRLEAEIEAAERDAIVAYAALEGLERARLGLLEQAIAEESLDPALSDAYLSVTARIERELPRSRDELVQTAGRNAFASTTGEAVVMGGLQNLLTVATTTAGVPTMVAAGDVAALLWHLSREGERYRISAALTLLTTLDATVLEPASRTCQRDAASLSDCALLAGLRQQLGRQLLDLASLFGGSPADHRAGILDPNARSETGRLGREYMAEARRWVEGGPYYVEGPVSTPPTEAPHRLTVLLIDSSGSMRDSDPRGLRRSAAAQLLDHLETNAAVGLVDFDTNPRLVTPEPSMLDHSALKTSIARIDARGGTDIAAALDAALRLLEGQPFSEKAIVLFTDGRHETRTPLGPTLARIGEAGWPVFTVGLSQTADAGLLSRIATLSGGAYLQAWDPADLAGLFEYAAFGVSGGAVTSTHVGQIRQGETRSYPVYVDPSIEQLRASITWPGSDLDLVLYDPTGVRRWGTGPGSRRVQSDTYEILEIGEPAPGRWRAEVFAADVEGIEPFSVRIGGRSGARVDLEVSGPSEHLEVGIPVRFRLVTEGLPAWSSGEITFLLRSPAGDTVFQGTRTVAAHGGLIELGITPEETGPLHVQARLVGTAGTDTVFTREIRRALSVTPLSFPKVVWVQAGYLRVDWGTGRITPGDRLEVRDDLGALVGRATVLTVHPQYSEAVIDEVWGVGPSAGSVARIIPVPP